MITDPRCEYRINPLGIDIAAPRFSWRQNTDRRGARQVAYRLQVASDPQLLLTATADLWDSGKVDSDQSVHIVYNGVPLVSRQRAYWKVSVWDEQGDTADSEIAWFEMGLLEHAEWRAKWIGATLRGGTNTSIPAPFLRKAFNLPGAIRSARLYITAQGLYECSINGQRIGEDVFTPGWTVYPKRIQYQVYDVSDLLNAGDNVIGAILGDGWAVGYVGWGSRQTYSDQPQLFAQLEITLADDSSVVIATDETWKYQFGPILEADMQMGEAHDARLEMIGWDHADFDARRWFTVESFPAVAAALVATNGPTVRRINELRPVSDPVNKGTLQRPRAIFDLGQNMVGWVRFKGAAPAGTTITLRFAEVLDSDGSLYTANLRTARATDYYTFGAAGDTIWEPKFTFHGFRYVELINYPGEVTRDTITGIVVHSATTPTGDFNCSNALINQLQHNIVWGQKGNFVDIPTDCPQRNERLGWTGDIQVFVRTAAFNMDIAGFMSKWARDLADSQREDGAVPAVVPHVLDAPSDGGPAWADAAIVCPWTIYQCYGDKRVLQKNYSVMTRFMNFMLEGSPGYIRCAADYAGWQGYGDWLAINAPTPRDLIGTAFLAYDAHLMSQIAAVLGETADAEKFARLFEAVKAAFGARFLSGGEAASIITAASSEMQQEVERADALSQGNLKQTAPDTIKSQVFNSALFTPTQTAYVLALHFDLLPQPLRSVAVSELVADIERRGLHLSTGFVGSPYLPHVLSSNGRLDTAYALLQQKTWPSWLYPVTQGATTIWERWDGWTDENGFQTPDMNSFNHYAYGAIGAWLYNTVAGIEIDPAQPGYKHSILRPQPGGGLTQAEGKLHTQYGELVSRWELKDGVFEWVVIVPPNTSATAYLPVSGSQMTMNGESISGAVQHLVAGKYQFTVD
ncbi:MAG: family 78 glycoside hydrolase catalytic domain [Anaerolineae bacterium]|nr:family 78 glycoside hydrolase catalytic domain [Anaerolineae bacterium]